MNRRPSDAAAASIGADPVASVGAELFRLTVLGTTDLHGNVLNWDYYKDAEYDDRAHNDVGLAKIAALIRAVRDDRGHNRTLTVDAGDTLQGTPLAYYYAKIDPIKPSVEHPVAAVMNAVGYDAAALGNHEFNYGLDLLRTFQAQLRHPLLGANVLDWQTGEAAFDEFVIKRVDDRVNVGIIGFVTPGCAIWDKAQLDGKLRFNGIVEQASLVLPKVQAAGADVVIVACHSGAETSSSYGDALPWPENAATLLAEQVPGIDAILVGHAHVEIGERFVAGPDGRQVLLSEPLKWGQRLSVMDLELRKRPDGRWEVVQSRATVLNANAVDEAPDIAALVRSGHERTRTYINGAIGSCSAAMSAATARFERTAALDLVNIVQASAVKQALADTPWSTMPVLSAAAPFNSEAGIPAGQVSVRDVAGLYSFDNTLEAVILTGAQVRAYLEFSAQYFKQVDGPGGIGELSGADGLASFDASEVTNAATELAPRGTPDYNYDVMGGLDAPLSYDIDIAEPPGRRIRNLTYDGKPLPEDQFFVLAVNNYRASGGGNYPAVTHARVVYDAQVEIRQLIIDWVSAAGRIDPSTICASAWRLVVRGRPVAIRQAS